MFHLTIFQILRYSIEHEEDLPEPERPVKLLIGASELIHLYF